MPGPMAKNDAGHVVTVGEIVLGDHRSRLLVIHVRVRIGFFELAQRLDAVVGNDKDVGIVVRVLQDRAQHLVEGDVLVGKASAGRCSMPGCSRR